MVRLNILGEDNQNYKVNRNISEVLEDINILCSSRGISTVTRDLPENGSTSLGKTRKIGSKILEHILEVVKLMNKGKNWNDAQWEVAKNFNISQSTINSNCSRGVRLKSVNDFKNLYENGKIKDYLIEKFPHDKSVIEEAFR